MKKKNTNLKKRCPRGGVGCCGIFPLNKNDCSCVFRNFVTNSVKKKREILKKKMGGTECGQWKNGNVFVNSVKCETACEGLYADGSWNDLSIRMSPADELWPIPAVRWLFVSVSVGLYFLLPLILLNSNRKVSIPGGGGGGVGGAPDRGVVLFNSQNKRIKEFFFSIVMCGWVMLQNMLGDLIELSVDRISGYCVPRPVQVTRLFGDSG